MSRFTNHVGCVLEKPYSNIDSIFERDVKLRYLSSQMKAEKKKSRMILRKFSLHPGLLEGGLS